MTDWFKRFRSLPPAGQWVVIIGSLLCVPLLVLLGWLYYGWALQTLWNWFAVPLGAPSLTLLEAIGLMILKALLTLGLKVHLEEKKTDKLDALVPALLVASGWLVRWVFGVA